MGDYLKAVNVFDKLSIKLGTQYRISFSYEPDKMVWYFTFVPKADWSKLIPNCHSDFPIEIICDDLIFTIKDANVLSNDIYFKFLSVIEDIIVEDKIGITKWSRYL